jgi:hypothetical protein
MAHGAVEVLHREGRTHEEGDAQTQKLHCYWFGSTGYKVVAECREVAREARIVKLVVEQEEEFRPGLLG